MTNEERVKFNALVEAVARLTERVDKLANPAIYNYIDFNLPEWAREHLQGLRLGSTAISGLCGDTLDRVKVFD